MQRYYGDSMPFGSESFEHEKISYLTVEHALADFAVLVTELKIQFEATKSKVVAFGGRLVPVVYKAKHKISINYLQSCSLQG